MADQTKPQWAQTSRGRQKSLSATGIEGAVRATQPGEQLRATSDLLSRKSILDTLKYGGMAYGALAGAGLLGAGAAGAGAGAGAGAAGAGAAGAGAGGGMGTSGWLTAAQLLASAAQGASRERQNQNANALAQAQLQQGAQNSNNASLLQALGLNQQAENTRAQMAMNAPSTRTRQALLGSLLQNARNTQITPPPGIRMGQISGGFDLNSLINPAARGAGRTLQSQATAALESGSDVPAPMDATSRLSTVGATTPYRNAGGLESVLTGGGMLAALLGTLARQNTRGNGASSPLPMDEDV